MKTASKIHSSFLPSAVRPFAMDAAAMDMNDVAALRLLGINLPERRVRAMIANMDIDGMGMDDTTGLVTTASISNPVQFLQAWLPGLVNILTAVRKADDLMGVMTVGAWEDEEIVQGVLEPLGDAVLYGDYTNIPLASWNLNFERRTVIRWEKGFMVGLLEEARSARVRVNTAAEKRNAAAMALEIVRNRVGFYGFNGGANRTYGFLNDPSLSAYITVASNGTTTQWSGKTYLQITADIRAAMAALQLSGQGIIDVKKSKIVLAVALAVDQYLSVTSDFGNSVSDWIKTTYPNVRVEAVPELTAANGGANVFYLYAESVADGGTDGGQVWAQMVPAKFQALGTEKRAKGYLEDFSNALGGVMLKRPFAVVRRSGV